MNLNKIILLLSGGMDSTALLYDFHDNSHDVYCLLFNYGQRHIAELDCARRHCQRLSVPFTVVELHRIQGLFARSALTDGGGTKIVPNRNACFLHIAASIAVGMGRDKVAIACNKDDQREFPDCTRDFIKSVNESLRRAAIEVEVIAPYIGLSKWQIARRASDCAWPIADTISCYRGDNCGECDACRLRKEALAK